MDRILEIRPEDRLAWVEPGLFNLDLGTALRGTGFTYMPDPSSQQVSSIGGNVGTNAGGTALPRVRRDVGPRARARRRARRRDRGARGLGGPGGGRLRPPRRGGGVRGDDRARRGRVRAPDARAARDHHDAAGLRDGRGLRGDGLGDHRARRRAGGPRDDGSGHRPRRGVVRARRVSDRRRSGAPRRGRRDPRRRRRRGPRGRGRRARARGRFDPRRRDAGGTRAPVEGTEVGVRRDRPDRAALPPPRLRRAAHEAGRGPHRRLRDLPPRRDHGDERVPRGRRQPAPVALVRPERSGCPRTRAPDLRGDRAAVRRRRGVALRRARDRAGEAGLHAARLHRGRPGGAGMRAERVRSVGTDEPAEGAARRRALRRLRGGGSGSGCAPRIGEAARTLPEGSWI